MKRYWMVHIPGSSCRYMHETRGSAVAEALRVNAMTRPGVGVCVLEAVGISGGVQELPQIDPVADHADLRGEKMPW